MALLIFGTLAVAAMLAMYALDERSHWFVLGFAAACAAAALYGLLIEAGPFAGVPPARGRTPSTHGTGCTFASAIAAALAKGESPRGAVALAKAYVTKALQSAYPVGQGRGPVHHFFRFWQPTIGIKNEEQGTGN